MDIVHYGYWRLLLENTCWTVRCKNFECFSCTMNYLLVKSILKCDNKINYLSMFTTHVMNY